MSSEFEGKVLDKQIANGEVKNTHGTLDLSESVELLKSAMQNVSKRIVGRDGLVQQTLLAILCREHQLIFSRTGTAKTLYGKTVFGQFDGQSFFIRFSKGTSEESVLGAYDINKFTQEGVMWHRTEKSILKADFAFLDEFYDANDMALRSLLGILNERELIKGEQQESAKLHTAIALTNYLRQTEMSEAVLDRFLFRASLAPNEDSFNRMLIDKIYGNYSGKVILPDVPISMEIPKFLSAIVKGEDPNYIIQAPAKVLFLKNMLVKNYTEMMRKEKEFYLSPRTVVRCRDVLNASALLTCGASPVV